MKKALFILILTIAFPTFLLSQKSAFTAQDAINVKSFSISDITDDGNYIVGTTRSRKDRFNVDHGRYGDPNYVSPSTVSLLLIDTKSGEQTTILPEKSMLRGVRFSPDGSEIAYILYDQQDYKIYSYNISKDKSRLLKIKSDLKVASNSGLLWTPDGENLIISLRSKEWAARGDSLFKEATSGPITIYDSKRPFLKWDEIRNYSSISIIASLNTKSGEVIELLPGSRYSGLSIPESGEVLVFTEYVPKKTVYERGSGTDYGMYSVKLNGKSEPDTLVKKSEKRISTSWNNKRTHYAYADSGRIFIRSVFEDDAVRITPDTMEVVKEDTSKAKFSFLRWSADDKHILASSKSGYWKVNVANPALEKVYSSPEDDEKAPRLSLAHWSKDLNYLYMSYSAKDKWERGLVRFNIQDQAFTDLVKDSNTYSRWTFSKDGSRIFYNSADGNMPDDIFTTDPDFKNTQQLTNLNPWIENKTLTRSELINYRDSDGKELFGILYYPANYEEGKKYPLVCEIYESFFNNGYSYSMNLIANAGYFGFKPSVNLIDGYPGEAWIKGITAGINKLIDQGLVDEDKLGVHGTSYGGYAASLLISQTDRFAAAINISGKTNIISFLGDSPRIGTRNYAAAENGQDRIGASLWDAPMKYINTSAVMFADRINTPHLLLTGEGDWNVPALNTRELYYAMRRLGKEVVWVNYINGGHGAGGASDEADFLDHWKRIIDWYEVHFKEKKEE